MDVAFNVIAWQAKRKKTAKQNLTKNKPDKDRVIFAVSLTPLSRREKK
ncbi:hypothetical protein KKG56_08960 [bacterium]|nr:hypothetical protein [bacterium]